MLGWAITSAFVAIVAAALAFSGLTGGLAAGARVVFIVAAVLFVIIVVVRIVRGQPPT
ncbi:MAG: DUF1328 domain-containing protein [Paracoccaceae bacterium]|nr:DUF1328 domain-containing protein [Paracoccaceae bacterium]